ncbi:hypothetical protein D3OALGB2SA_4051 [Olavius algarvensis associated proteobacterium Delta 3]|nr:hypothetical protein D3OALGB2SA_4051 [Olavius algarvensis associated proteobacterium Delta 3]
MKRLSRPDAKRKISIAFIFVFAYALSIAQLGQDLKSLTSWGTFLALTLMAVSAWPLIKDFVWPSGLDHVAATELSLACHSWKNAYFRIYPGLTGRLKYVEGENIWDKILSASNHKCTKENIALFYPLFVDAAMKTQNRIDSVILRYSDVLPEGLRVLARQTMEKLSLAPVGYAFIMQEASDLAFYNQFRQVINALSELERPAQELQNRTKRK